MPYTVIGGIGEAELESAASMNNKCNILTLNNVVMFCDNVILTDYLAFDPILVMSEESFFPDTDICLPVCITHDSNTEIVPLYIEPNGSLVLHESYENATLWLNGICFNVNSKYYTPLIGNIYNNGTSPLTDSLS